MISPLKDSMFDMLHSISHYIEDRIQTHNKTSIKTTKIHTHDAFGHHINTETSHHSHIHEKKVTTDHTHQLLTFLNTILSSSDKQKEHQKSILKTDIDKHLITSEFSFKNFIFNSTSKQTWYTFLPVYNFKLSVISPPPKYIS